MARNRERYRALRVEQLEQRALLSIAAVCDPIPCDPVQGAAIANPNSPDGTGYTPANIRGAYGISSIEIGGVAGTGAGQTIAIIDAFNDPNILSDVAAFNSNADINLQAFNVAGGPTLTVLDENGNTIPNQTGTTRTSGPQNAAKGTTSWSVEESLDVEWAHSIAPQANIILFEANTANMTDLLTAVSTAADYSGVSVVSMSWGTGEFSGETANDSYFTTPGGHANVTFLASTGDSGAPGEYPAYSPNIIAVGGTTLTASITTNAWQSETAWSSGGGGASSKTTGDEPEPSYQTAANIPDSRRAGNAQRLLRRRSQHRRAHLRFL